MTILEKTVTAEDVVWELDSNEFNVPDGEYRFRTTAFDYKQDVNVPLVWESDLPVEVNQGYMDRDSALAAAAHLIQSCGYWGRFLEDIRYDPISNTFDISIGS